MKYWIWLSTLPYIGTVSARKIITVLKNPKNVYYSSEEELRKIGNLTLRQRNSILMNRELENAKRIIEQCEKHRISLLPIENPLYPKRAGNCNDATTISHYKGTIPRMDKTDGIVGARRCTQETKRAVAELAVAYTEKQTAVISGMAKGVDSYYYYHFNKKVREKGNEITEFKVTKEYIKLVRTMQDKMIAELACKGIGIETNPSSNYLIGTIKKYEEHPILRFNSRKLKDTNTGENLCVSINTDDQGVFDTLLENEYALMTLALKKATDDDMNALYDIEDIYEWIDYVRKMGINQVFS